MASEPELLRLLAEAPGDVATLQIYADWLEEEADHHRAAYLRTELAVRGLTAEDPRIPATVDALRLLIATLDRDWTDRIVATSVAGRVYAGISMKNPFTARFLPEGAVNYTQSNNSYQNGTWWQRGSLVYWELNQFYAEYTGALVGDRLIGTAENVSGFSWEFDLAVTTKPELVAIPENTDTTVYGNGNERWTKPPKSPAPKKRKPKRKKKKPFSAARRSGSAGGRAGRRPA